LISASRRRRRRSIGATESASAPDPKLREIDRTED
jgi:hypothetical protein